MFGRFGNIIKLWLFSLWFCVLHGFGLWCAEYIDKFKIKILVLPLCFDLCRFYRWCDFQIDLDQAHLSRNWLLAPNLGKNLVLPTLYPNWTSIYKCTCYGSISSSVARLGNLLIGDATGGGVFRSGWVGDRLLNQISILFASFPLPFLHVSTMHFSTIFSKLWFW